MGKRSVQLKGVKDILSYKAYRFRLYPNKNQEILIAKTIGCSRFIYNHFLNLWNTAYRETGKGLTYNSCSAMLPTMKKQEETKWLQEADSVAIQGALKNLADAFSRFFSKQNEKPRFKSKKNSVQSYTTKNTNNSISITGNKIKLPKLGLVKFAKSRELKGRIINVTVRKKASGKYYISILSEEDIKEFPQTNKSIGIDLGISYFAVLSNGEKVSNKRFSSNLDKKIKREQRKLSRRQMVALSNGIDLLNAKNYQKQKIKLARLHEKVANQREDFLNKLSTDIIKNHDIICIEDLNTSGMLRNGNLAKSISDVSWNKFVTRLQYKSNWYGRRVVKIDRWVPSSQICSECEYNNGKKALHIREWACKSCGVIHDRDINASKNILKEGIKSLGLN